MPTRPAPDMVRSLDHARSIEADPRWTQVVARDRSANGSFVFCVRTTGIYCLPSCGSRLPKPQNVEFHATSSLAERAGFRACLRCNPATPLQPARATELARTMCAFIDAHEAIPSLDAIAASVGLSTWHAHRCFKAVMGITPNAYARALRRKKVRSELPQAVSITAAIFNAGYNSNGRFYDEARDALGMTASAFRARGKGQRIRYTVRECTLGYVLIAHSERGLCAVFPGDSIASVVAMLDAEFPNAQRIADDTTHAERIIAALRAIDFPHATADLPLDLRGTAFQQRVWKAIRAIPPGHTQTYAQIAEAIGSPDAVRAVGSACGANSLAVLVPCHRVVRADKSLSGYRWGIDRKRALLQREKLP